MNNRAYYIKVSGRVQGVGYRYHCQKSAEWLGIKGWVRNLPDGDVDMEIKGPERALDEYKGEITRKDAWFKVSSMEVKEISPEKEYDGFTIKMY